MGVAQSGTAASHHRPAERRQRCEERRCTGTCGRRSGQSRGCGTRTDLTRVRISLLYFLLYSRLRMLTRVAFVGAPMQIAAAALRCESGAGEGLAGIAMNPVVIARQHSSSRVLILARDCAERPTQRLSLPREIRSSMEPEEKEELINASPSFQLC